MERVDKAIKLFSEHKYDEALSLLDACRDAGVVSFDLSFYRGKILQKMSRYGEAINCFNEAKVLIPDDSRPDLEIALIRNILSITNNFYYENPYTDLDLIDNL